MLKYDNLIPFKSPIYLKLHKIISSLKEKDFILTLTHFSNYKSRIINEIVQICSPLSWEIVLLKEEGNEMTWERPIT